MTQDLGQAVDAVLQGVVEGDPRVPGVVAIATDREGNIYEGAAGKRVLGAPHQALDNTPPAEHYSPSPRSWDGVLRQPERIACVRSATPMPR